eukprot:RCo019239
MADPDYDEFGNYIGAVLPEEREAGPGAMDEDDEEEDEVVDDEEEDTTAAGGRPGEPEMALVPADGARGGEQLNQIVLHEDKKFYPDAEELYGDAEVRVEEEDTQPLDKPVIAPVKIKQFNMPVKPPKGEQSQAHSFMIGLTENPQFVRNVALIGHLHHGKTTFMDYLLHTEGRHTDVRIDEQQRGVSIKCTPCSIVLQNTKGKSFLINVVDTPGHVNFVDEVSAAVRLCDGVCIVVDAIEGVMVNTEKLIKHAIAEQLPLCLVVNKVDRLILELKLPPDDAYIKLRHTIEEVNNVIAECPHLKGVPQKLSPELGNVAFASSRHGWSFTVQSFAKLYAGYFPGLDHSAFARRLWGDIYYNEEARTFSKKRGKSGDKEDSRSFVHFVLSPLYKLYSQVVGTEPEKLDPVLFELGLRLSREQRR